MGVAVACGLSAEIEGRLAGRGLASKLSANIPIQEL